MIDLSRCRHECDFVWNDIICSELFVSKVIWKNPMDDYNGPLNFLAAVCVALLFFVVVLGHSRHDTGQRSACQKCLYCGAGYGTGSVTSNFVGLDHRAARALFACSTRFALLSSPGTFGCGHV